MKRWRATRAKKKVRTYFVEFCDFFCLAISSAKSSSTSSVTLNSRPSAAFFSRSLFSFESQKDTRRLDGER